MGALARSAPLIWYAEIAQTLGIVARDGSIAGAGTLSRISK